MSLITTLIFLTVFIIKISINKNIELKEYKSKQVVPKTNIRNNKPQKKYDQYSDVIHIVNKYNGEIKQLTAKNGHLIDTDVKVTGNEKMLSDFLGDLIKYKNLKNFNSITLDNSSGDKERHSIDVNAQFNTDK